MSQIAHYLYALQSILSISCLLFLFFTIRNKILQKIKSMSSEQFVLCISLLFLVLIFSFSPLLGDAVFSKRERPELTDHFIPFATYIVFMTPYLFSNHFKFFKRVSYLTVLIFIILNLTIVNLAINSYLNYQGKTYPLVDVQLKYKEDLVNFVANDWKRIYPTEQKVPIEYDLTAGVYNWIEDHGKNVPAKLKYPFTVGRTFDYILLRKHGLRNLEEGIQARSKGKARYVVNYKFEKAPVRPQEKVIYLYFGWLRLSIFS
ncbi:MAG: hypothetical protein HQK51_20480 [Oligoflexia bacterium]|nr:hypothetical protein [Oligoflexia bacterium]